MDTVSLWTKEGNPRPLRDVRRIHFKSIATPKMVGQSQASIVVPARRRTYHPAMSLIDGKWWEENQTRARRLFAICSLVALALVFILFHSEIRGFFSSHSWWEDALVALAGIATPVLAYFELRHSGEANELRREANVLRADALRLQEMIGELEVEKAQHLGQIAANTQRPVTQTQRNAEMLRRHKGACVSVTEGQGSWPSTPQIVEVSEANIVTLFTPSTGSNPQASCVQADCGELEISDIPHGSCPLRVTVRRRYGATVPLGEITRWEDRNRPAAEPRFNKGGNVYHATFSKQGSAEARSLHIYISADGSNSFLLEPSVGERVVADNVEISRRFMLMEINYRAAGFSRSGSGTDGSPHPLFIW
jgi:hypothetical protein